MKRERIDISRFTLPVARSWLGDGLLLTAGDFRSGRFNPMTVGWGALGVMWGKPMALVVVRPTRFTHGLMEEYPDFTLCALPAEHADKLQYCGNHSGRDGDKVAACGLTPVASSSVAAPGYEEAELVVECTKMYADDYDPGLFLAPFIEGNYPKKDYHRLYLGEIRAVYGTRRYGGAW